MFSRSVNRAARASAPIRVRFQQKRGFAMPGPGGPVNLFHFPSWAAALAIGLGAHHFLVGDLRETETFQFLSSYIGAGILRLLDPEEAHECAIWFAERGLCPIDGIKDEKQLQTTVWGIPFSNPLCLAAGFDKNGQAMDALIDCGFGAVEIGSVTPQPQEGNPKPRVFRLAEDKAVINRYGFNSDGIDVVAARLAQRQRLRELKFEEGETAWRQWCRGHRSGIVGVNVGKNKTSESDTGDYTDGIRRLGRYADYIVINVSSPNTPGLRHLQRCKQLKELIVASMKARDTLPKPYPPATAAFRPLLVKVAPDLTGT